MTDLSVIILTKNEQLHIGRCLEKLVPLEPRQIFVVDCFSTDGTQDVTRGLGATVVEHKWPGNQAAQFNWALDNLPVEAKWILRLDADEYLTPESIAWLKVNLDKIDEKVDALEFTLERKFMGGEIRHGTKAWGIRCKDRFGDYGIIGCVVIADETGGKWRVKEFVMSCRVAKKGCEAKAIGWVKQEIGAKKLVADIVDTGRNGALRDAFRDIQW